MRVLHSLSQYNMDISGCNVAGSEETDDKVSAIFHHRAKSLRGLRQKGGAHSLHQPGADGRAQGQHQEGLLHLRRY